MFPEITTDRSESEDSRQRLESTLQVTWDTINKESFDCLSPGLRPALHVLCQELSETFIDQSHRWISP
jgi:hypothetical protein